jgi:hypothetical protein
MLHNFDVLKNNQLNMYFKLLIFFVLVWREKNKIRLTCTKGNLHWHHTTIYSLQFLLQNKFNNVQLCMLSLCTPRTFKLCRIFFAMAPPHGNRETREELNRRIYTLHSGITSRLQRS